MFDPAEIQDFNKLLDAALVEDLGANGDLTSLATIPEKLVGRAAFVARTAGVVAGLPAAELIFRRLDPRITFAGLTKDGTVLEAGTALARVEGPLRGILAGERTALNFLQRLSGVATLTRRFVDAVAGLPVKLLDTRKTTPGWRRLEKYAVRQGGGHNHRMGLFDGILIKDNHLAALGGGPGAVEQAVALARARFGSTIAVEVEVDTLEQLDVALAAEPDIVLLDNMNLEQLAEAVRRRNKSAPKVLLEASGGVNLTTVRGIAETGVDRISVGAITHSAVALDIGLDYLV